MEAKAERDRIILTPKLVVDREYTPAQRRVIDARLAVSLEQAKKGETYGPFQTHEDMTAFLHREAKKAPAKETRIHFLITGDTYLILNVIPHPK